MTPATLRWAIVIAGLLGGESSRIAAQELEPGSYQNAPVGVNAVFAGYGFSQGNVLIEAALPVEGATATVHSVSMSYLRTLSLFGRSAKFDVQVPLSYARFEGVVGGEFRRRSPRGFTDPRLRLLVNLFGAPALDAPGFARYRQRTILGASVQTALPLGQYDRDRLINLGAHRFAFRPEVALSHARNQWLFEAAAGAWLFTKNSDYFGGSTLAQRPLYFAKGNVIYSFRRGLWVSVSYGHATGGETSLNDLARHDLQRNNRVGAAMSWPFDRASALRFVATTGLTTRLGADFDTFGVGYQRSWGGRNRTAEPTSSSAQRW